MTFGPLSVRPGTFTRPGVILSPKDFWKTVSWRFTITDPETYQKNVRPLIETNSRDTFLNDRGRIVPWLANCMANHLLSLITIQLGLGSLTRNDHADFCWKIHWILAISAVDDRKVRLLQDAIVCYVQVSN